jgi:hypothetical protein
MEFADTFNRWSGHGNAEFRRNVSQAHSSGAKVRLIIVRTDDVAHVQAGEDASVVRKDFFLRDDLIGEVAELKGDEYVIRFRKA